MSQPDAPTLDLAALQGLDLPGVFPARQERSRAVAMALFQAALRLLRDRGFEALSIADLCAAAGVTTGSFYARFEGKEAFLRALQQLVIAEAKRDIDERMVPARYADLGLREFVQRIVDSAVRWSRRNEGLMRASLRAAQVDPESWSPLRELGRYRVERAVPIILAKLGRPPTAAAERAVRFAFQILYGTQNNMVLINPGPYTIHDAATPRLIAEAMVRLIEAESEGGADS